MRRVSPKALRQRIYLLRRVRYLMEHLACERCLQNHASQIHHKAGRSQSLLLAERYWMAVCPECHSWIHAHPREARQQGYTLRRSDLP